MPDEFEIITAVHGQFGPSLQAAGPTQEARASLPLDGAHGKPPKLLLERASFGHLPLFRRVIAMLRFTMPFQLESNYTPRGDQAQAIAKLAKSLEAGNRHQTLLGVTGSGKTFTIANAIREIDRPTLVISHNKTLAAQLYSEFKQFFPGNAVEYFVSYFDYYQPEAYIPRTDTFIEKDSCINEEIERLRLSTTSALLSRRDVIVVASVSCIYGIIAGRL